MVNKRQAEVPVPPAMQHLPLTDKGYHKPWFVKDNDPRIINEKKYVASMTKDRCWVCGGANKKLQVFVTDIPSAVNYRSLEPPCHEACAVYAVKVCPFLLLPKAKRREAGLPDAMINQKIPEQTAENPGAYVLSYVSRFRFNPIDKRSKTKWAVWKPEHVTRQSLWTEGEIVAENADGLLPRETLIAAAQ